MNVDREAETLVVCAACDGDKMRVVETGSGYRGEACKPCGGSGVMSREQVREYRARQRPA